MSISADFARQFAVLCHTHNVDYAELIPILERSILEAGGALPPRAGAAYPGADTRHAAPGAAQEPVRPPHFLDDYRPVRPRKLRADGWTALRQRMFLSELAEGASLEDAADAVGLGLSAAYKLRRRPEGKRFAEAWDHALDLAARGTEQAMADGSASPCVSAPGSNSFRREERYRAASGQDAGRVAPNRAERLRMQAFGAANGSTAPQCPNRTL